MVRRESAGVSCATPHGVVPSVVRRISAALFAALFAVGVLAPASFAASSTVPKAVPKVVFIVGPSGDATSGYRAEARAAAAIARTYTPDVIELYSPEATWSAVKDALDGASLVVYMGHGNGWPSRYRDALYPATEDGFGLNPVAGGDDSTHQYFGEASLAAQVKLAKNAVVLLNHLCYASGNSEPGLAEGTLDQARQRVDNYAAGFVRAGAAAVVAEAWASPSYFVKTVLGGSRSIQNAWRDAPSANGHVSAFASARSVGYVAEMDSESATSGFTRSIVMRAGLASRDVLAGASGSGVAGLLVLPPEPTLTTIGIKLGSPTIVGLPSAATSGHIDVPVTIKDRKALPKGLEASVRWDPIDVAIVPTDPATEVDPTQPASAPSSAPIAHPGALGDPGAVGTGARRRRRRRTPSRASTSRTETPDLIIAEQLGDVVAPAGVKLGKTALSVPVTFPSAPGRYRLTISLFDGNGVAYDAATQAMIPSLILRVTGDFDGSIQAASTANVTAGTAVALDVRVANLGRTPWGHAAVASAASLGAGAHAQAASVVGRWIPLSVDAAASRPTPRRRPPRRGCRSVSSRVRRSPRRCR